MTEEQLYIEIDRAITDPLNRQNTAAVVRAILKLIVKNARQWITEVSTDPDNIDLSNYYTKAEVDNLLAVLGKAGLQMYRLTLENQALSYTLPEYVTNVQWVNVIGLTGGPYVITDLAITPYDPTTRVLSGWHYPTENPEDEVNLTAIPPDAVEFEVWYNSGQGTSTTSFTASALSSTSILLTWD